jgi:aldehyde dehydrogenase (NAD+)
MANMFSTNPFRPEEVVVEVRRSEPDEVPAILERAEHGRRQWQAEAATSRSRALGAAADALEAARGRIVDLVVSEVGKPISEARGEVQRGIDILRYHAQAILMSSGDLLPGSTATGLQFTRRRPLGTVVVVTPWNFPVAIPLWKAVPAIAWGNAVVLKPSSEAVAVADAITQIIGAHLPAGVLQCVPGNSELVRRLLSADGVHAVSFTGSTAVGRQLIKYAAERAIPCQAEMGGSNPSIVLADADIDRAASTIASSAMAFAGQKCTATSRIIVEDRIYDAFRDSLVDHVRAIRVGDPTHDDTVAGPVISRYALDDALDAVGRSAGRVLVGGAATGQGFMMSPTLVEADGADDVLLTDEVFAPVAALVRAKDPGDAMRLANDTPYGLSAGLFTNDLGVTLQFLDAVEAGMLRVNASTTGVDYWAPFGGMKSSSYGAREQGQSARDFYTESCTVFIDR